VPDSVVVLVLLACIVALGWLAGRLTR